METYRILSCKLYADQIMQWFLPQVKCSLNDYLLFLYLSLIDIWICVGTYAVENI